MKRSLPILCAIALLTTAVAAPPDVSGKWKWVYERSGEAFNIEMDLKQEGAKLTGKIIAPEGREAEIREGKISDDGTLKFHINFERDSGPLKISFNGKASGDSIKGQSEYTNDSGEKREREWNPKREQSKSLTGKWNSVFKRSDGTPMEATLQLKQNGNTLTGSHSFNDNETEIRDGKVDGENVSFRMVRERDGRTVTSKYKGKLQKDNSIKGEIESDWTGEVRKLEWEARKTN